jgi:hypothetical protein
MAKRGRKALSPEQREQRQEAKAAQKAEAVRAAGLAKLPAGPDGKERRNELFRELDNLKKDAQGVSGEISAQKKRMEEVHGITKEAMKIRAILAGCKDGVFEATVQQVALFMKDLDRPFQLDMFTGEAGQGVADDQGSVFDATDAGEAQAAERKDDPAKASRRKSAEPPTAPQDTGSLAPDEAQRAFEKNKDKVVPLRGSATEELAAANAKDEEFLRGQRKPKAPLEGADAPGSYAVS